MRLLLLFILVPLIEIGLFIQVGGWIGLWPTLGIVLATAVAGTALVRSQGARAMQKLRTSFEDLRDPTEPLAHGAMILLSGALLLTPGFFTDAVGFALLVPGIRRSVMQAVARRIDIRTVDIRGPWRNAEDGIIEGTYRAEDGDRSDGPRDPSGWTRH